MPSLSSSYILAWRTYLGIRWTTSAWYYFMNFHGGWNLTAMLQLGLTPSYWPYGCMYKRWFFRELSHVQMATWYTGMSLHNHDEVTTPFPMIWLQLSTAGVEARVYKALNLGIVQLVDNLKTLRKMKSYQSLEIEPMHGFIFDAMRQNRGKWKATSHQKLNPCMASSLSHQCRDHWAMTTEQPLHLYCKAGTECISSIHLVCVMWF